MQETSVLWQLGANAGLIAFVVFGFNIIGCRASTRGTVPTSPDRWGPMLVCGLLFGLAAIVSMRMPVQAADGVFFDARQIILALAGYFLPTPAVWLSTLLAAAYRGWLGGMGAGAGMAVIVASATLGWLAARYPARSGSGASAGQADTPYRTDILRFALLGLSVAGVSLLLTLTLPEPARWNVLRVAAPSLSLVFPVAMGVFGLLMLSGVRLREREAALRLAAERNEQAAGFFTHSQDGLFILDAESRFVEVNPAFCAMVDYPPKELIGQSVMRVTAPTTDPRLIDALKHRLQTHGTWEGEIWRRRRNGELFLTHMRISAVRDASGRVKQEVVVCQDLTEQRRQAEALARAASHDPLTGLPNRRALTQRLQAVLEQADREVREVGICYLDLDHFKTVTQAMGPEAGDQLLVQVAEALRRALGPDDALGRPGGDEFLAVFAHVAGADAAVQRAESLRRLVEERFRDIGGGLTASIGLTVYPDDRGDADALMRHADQAMYLAKEQGRNRVHLFDVGHDRLIRQRTEVLSEVARAIHQGEMRLHYQPKVLTDTREPVGAEALVRWHHPEQGLQAPAMFLGHIIGTAVARELDLWVLQEGCRQANAWALAGLGMSISVNMSVSTLVETGFVERVRALLDSHPDLPPGSLEIELLESETFDDLTLVGLVIEQLEAIGVRVAIDDFGTGYASLLYLQRLPAQSIKIDQGFVRDMLRNEQDRALVKGIVELARAFGRVSVAEGVETDAHAAMLHDMGCDVLQGYGIARPMPADALVAWHASWQATRQAQAAG